MPTVFKLQENNSYNHIGAFLGIRYGERTKDDARFKVRFNSYKYS